MGKGSQPVDGRKGWRGVMGRFEVCESFKEVRRVKATSMRWGMPGVLFKSTRAC